MSTTGPSQPAVTVEFGGRLVNADAGGPVSNVRVSLEALSSSGGIGLVSGDPIATSGGDGTFALKLDLPSDWRAVFLRFTGPAGYDDMGGRFEPTAAPCHFAPCWAATDRPEIRMYPTLVIRPGESMEVRVDSRIAACGAWGGDAGPCRRVLVSASPGDAVELELVPIDSSKPMGLSPDATNGAYDPVPRLMVPPGAFPYVIGDGTARLTARR